MLLSMYAKTVAVLVDVKCIGRHCWYACWFCWACWQKLLMCMLWDQTVDVHVDVVKHVCQDCWCACWCEACRQTLLMCTLMALDLKAETVHVYVDVVRPVGRNCWMCMLMLGARIACWLERWTCDRKVTNSNPGRRIFFSSQLCVLTVTRCLFHPRVTAVACKRPW